jgi:cbb3-type cytochrome oxidase subunit 3
LIILIGLGSLFLIVLLSAGIWYWFNRTNRLRRQHSLPLTVNDFIETTKIQEKRLSSSPIKAPPVPPRPTAYTTILGKIEYRSNL